MACLAHGLPMVTFDGRFTEPPWREGGVRLVSGEAQAIDAAAALGRDAGARAALSRAALDLYDRHFDVRHTVAALQGSLAVAG
jgi:hypothetical protein